MPFSSNTVEELNLLMQFDSPTSSKGIKVHSDARQEAILACERLHERGLVNQSDGGYLTDAGIETLAHLQALAGLLGLEQRGSRD
jgi:uncharacterized protein (TIGR02647 family)